MSVDYCFACHECKKVLHVAQDGLGGFSFFYGEEDCMKKLRDFMESHIHSGCKGRSFEIVDAQSEEVESYAEIYWEE